MKSKVIIIAEAGVNHNGDLSRALQMVDIASDSGADYVKFQTFKAEKLVNSAAKMAEYQVANTGREESQLAMLRRLELREDDFRKIAEHCRQKGIGFLSTPFDIESVDFLVSLGMDYIKIPSGEITNYPYIRHISRLGIPVIMSTGMCGLEEVRDAFKLLLKGGLERNDITLLHCNTQYPTPMEDVNLRAMSELRHEFGTAIGYSDHTLGTEVPIAAVALGATVIEKHFTLDRNLPGPDQVVSLEPVEFRSMARAIRNISLALGSGHKQITPSERNNMAVARKSIVAAKDIAEGEVFTEENLTVKRPGTGISPMRWPEIIGRKACRAFMADEIVEIPEDNL